MHSETRLVLVCGGSASVPKSLICETVLPTSKTYRKMPFMFFYISKKNTSLKNESNIYAKHTSVYMFMYTYIILIPNSDSF